MKTVLVVAAVTAYGLIALAIGLVLGAYLGWQRRRRVDEWTLADADKVIDQAITDRQHAIDQAALAEATLARLTQRFCADVDREYERLLDEER